MNTEEIAESTLKEKRPSKIIRQYRVKKLGSNNVVDCEGARVGKLIDMIVSYPSGRVTFAVMSCGGFLGFGEVMFMVPWQNIELDIKKQEFVLSINIECLKKAPSFSGSSWPNLHNNAWMHHVLKFYESVSVEKPQKAP
ncbi:PRC-barrel domain-containing protein [Planctobacterium marinum]|uniref:PRC-barrel domain-containing protein n=1 Tax=Planctobacterium marinum TaxID=1631968 RepID=UPI001E514F4D|nr:PRC-barrel domain-containing protein [Planctobacterium marinum]MCC2604933.1 PRC-barrel domain-containing protein [Planctobacterium marinum]